MVTMPNWPGPIDAAQWGKEIGCEPIGLRHLDASSGSAPGDFTSLLLGRCGIRFSKQDFLWFAGDCVVELVGPRTNHQSVMEHEGVRPAHLGSNTRHSNSMEGRCSLTFLQTEIFRFAVRTGSPRCPAHGRGVIAILPRPRRFAHQLGLLARAYQARNSRAAHS